MITYTEVVFMPAGRPTKICPEVRAQIITAIKANLPYEYAAWSARVSPRILYSWLEQGRKDEAEGIISEHSEFLHDIKAAEAFKIINHVKAVEDQTERWQARSWILERRFRKDFALNGEELKDMADTLAQLKSMIDELVEKKHGSSKEEKA